MLLQVNIDKQMLADTARQAARQLPDKCDLYLALAEYVEEMVDEKELCASWGGNRSVLAMQIMNGIVLQCIYGTEAFRKYMRDKEIAQLEKNIEKMKRGCEKMKKEDSVTLELDGVGTITTQDMIESCERNIRKQEKILEQLKNCS